MKKLFPILFVIASSWPACAADIPQDPAPSGDAIIVQFDPAAVPNAIVPLPNDLAIMGGKIVVPPTKDAAGNITDSPAQKEFNEQYLGTLDGFPYESNASVRVSGDLDPASVNVKTVICFDVTNPAMPTQVTIAPTYANKTITIPPPDGEWLRAHQYAIATLGGANGLKGAKGEAVIGSQTWALVKSRNSLVTCPGDNLASPDCLPAVDIIPSAKEDPAEKLAEQTKLALQLETIRRGYDPILKALAGAPVNTDRKDIPILWTFKIVDAGEMTFDPANPKGPVIPFPNDVARTGKNGTVALPHPKTGKPLTPADCNTTDNAILLVCGLNTLDGFSMLAPLVSENSVTEGAISQSALSKDNLIDGKTLDVKSVGLVKLQTDRPAALATQPNYTPCLNCASSKKADGAPQTSPQQLQWSFNAPLDQHTLYAGYVTNAVKDSKGKGVIANPVFALARSSNTLLTPEGKSSVSLITDDQAKLLEPLRLGYKAMFDALEKNGVKRTDTALAFPFTTQSSDTILEQLVTFPAAAKVLFQLSDSPQVVVDATAAYTAAAAGATIPIDNVSKFFAGQWLTPVAVTGPGGTLNPTGAKLLPVTFAIAVPKGTPPAGGWPVTIFGHGITRWRNDFLALANALAGAGQMVIATDVIWHGDRTSCTGSKATTGAASDDDSCADSSTMMCDGGFQGLCILKAGARNTCTPNVPVGDPLGDLGCLGAGQGRCAKDGKCQGAGASLKLDASTRPEISGWNEFSLTNFFATRDNFRQQVIDLGQLVAVLKGAGVASAQAPLAASLRLKLKAANGGADVAYDVSKLNYVGQSFGGILGGLFNSVSPDTTNVVLNVPGGAVTQIILNAPAFAKAKKALIDTLAASGIQPGTPGFDQFIGIAQWVLDEADPAVIGYRLTHGVPFAMNPAITAPNPNRKVFIQFIEGDETVPNISNFALVAGANRTFEPTMKPGLGCKPPLFCYEFTPAIDMFDATSAPTSERHGFLLKPPSATAAGLALTTKAQTQVATFIATGALP